MKPDVRDAGVAAAVVLDIAGACIGILSWFLSSFKYLAHVLKTSTS